MQKNRGFLLWESSFVCLLLFDSWETDCVWFGKFASLFAFVLFASGCVVRIGYESFLDCSLQEFFYVSRMANSIFRFLLDSCYCKLSTLCRGQLAPCLEDALPLCPFGTFPHTVGNHPPPSRASSTAVRLRRLCVYYVY